MTFQVQCLNCGQWHDENSKILKKHLHAYFKSGGTQYLNQMERRLKA